MNTVCPGYIGSGWFTKYQGSEVESDTAENVAKEWQITREEQDRFAVASQNKAEAAKKAGRFKDEIVPVTVKTRKGDVVVDGDEYIRDGATYETLAGLRPAFDNCPQHVADLVGPGQRWRSLEWRRAIALLVDRDDDSR